MPISRRAFLKDSAALFAASLIPQTIFDVWLQTPAVKSSWQASASGLPRVVVEDFSRSFDPAYLSNGLIGIRPGPNPLAKAMTQVSGFVFAHVPLQVESLSPAPYPLETDIRVQNTSLLKRADLVKVHRQQLDMSSGELATELTFAPAGDLILRIHVLQFASRTVPCLLCQEIQIEASRETEIELETRINRESVPGRIYMDEAPERTEVDLASGFESGGSLSKLGVALLTLAPEGLGKKLDPSRTVSGPTRSYVLKANSRRPVRFQTIAAMVSDAYHPEPALEAIRLVNWGGALGFDHLRTQNRQAWADLWRARVKVIGDTDAQRVLDAAFFYLHSSLHRSTRTGMPPFGLSQFGYYYGHSFWDSESWSLLPVTLAVPATGRALLEYRVRGLPAARRLAALYGYSGIQFPWEAAQTSGFEVTPTFAGTGWVEQHVTPDVALGFWEYQLATGDLDFLQRGTWPVLQGVAQWIESRVVSTARGFEIQHIMGPNEGIPNVNNDSYMNLVCKIVLAAAARCAQMVGRTPPASWGRIHDGLVLPLEPAKQVVLPYDSPPSPTSPQYSGGNLDFLTVHDPPVTLELLRNTHDYEESFRRRVPIGFAAAALAATAAFLGEKRQAAQLFNEARKTSWLEPFGMMREVPSQDYGCFLTNFGSLLQTTMLGFTGIRVNERDWRKYPASLPAGWTQIEIDRIWIRGEPKRLVATDGVLAKVESA